LYVSGEGGGGRTAKTADRGVACGEVALGGLAVTLYSLVIAVSQSSLNSSELPAYSVFSSCCELLTELVCASS
jgi:hypothetical protein